jgi:hypothetical protein
MGLHEIKKLQYNKRNDLKIKEDILRIGENLCQLYLWQGIDNQNIQEAQKTKLPPNLWPNEEIGNELNKNFSKEEVQMEKKTWKNAHRPWP